MLVESRPSKSPQGETHLEPGFTILGGGGDSALLFFPLPVGLDSLAATHKGESTSTRGGGAEKNEEDSRKKKKMGKESEWSGRNYRGGEGTFFPSPV